MYRSACVKEFEIILEQADKLLRKYLKVYGKKFAEYTLKLLPGFIADAIILETAIGKHLNRVRND
ncbi:MULTISPECIES: hypothetical protein [unclassified Endozoicomonas]|uniref:hypothetical protein n=1 Tax=unclassified Endozoicomonas TaxID=2644528 RepID=UPI002148FFA9|nr:MULTISPECIES: hypothetical protein [unclassified Endozoicomonas]